MASFGVTQHLADGFDGHSVSVGYGRGECLAGKVRGYSFLDAEDGCNLLQIVVILRIADNRQQVATRAFLLVLAQNREWNIEQFYF